MTATPPPVPSAATHECSSCHRHFPANLVLQIEGCWICAECKPLVIQTLTESGRLGGATVARNGRQLVMSRDAQLPDRCIKCNTAEGVTRLRRNLYWHHPAIYLCVLFNVLVYIIVAMCVRKSATIEVGLCPVHRKRRHLAIAAGWGSLLLFVLTVVAAANGATPWLMLAGGVFLLAGGIAGAVIASTVTPVKIDAEFIRLKGVNAKFLAELPVWRG